MTARPPERIPEEKVATILARAAELDRDARETVDLEAVRTAALQAGISLEAVDAALAEFASGEPAAPAEPPAAAGDATPRWKRWLRKLVSPVLHGAVALAAGSFIGAAGEGAEVFIAGGFLAFFYAAWRLVKKHRPSRTAWVYQLAVALMTFWGALGLAGAGGDEDLAVVFVAAGISLFAAGSIAIKVRLSWERKSLPLELPERAP